MSIPNIPDLAKLDAVTVENLSRIYHRDKEMFSLQLKTELAKAEAKQRTAIRAEQPQANKWDLTAIAAAKQEAHERFTKAHNDLSDIPSDVRERILELRRHGTFTAMMDAVTLLGQEREKLRNRQ